MSLQRVPLKDFRGGLNTRDGPFDLMQNEAQALLNVTLSALVGTLEMRKGKTRLDTAGMPNETVDFAKQAVIGNNKRFLMLSINGNVWACKPNGEVIKLHTGTAGTIWDFEVAADAAFKDWVYMCNGVDTAQKWDGEAAATVNWPSEKSGLPNGKVLSIWMDRMFVSGVAANPQRVYFTEFGDVEANIAPWGFVDVRGPEDDLDEVQDLIVLGSRLIVLKRRSVFFISSPVTMLNRRIGGPGAFSRFQCVEMEDKVYFFNPQGLWSTGGVEITMESGSINNWFPKHLNPKQLTKARLIATRDSYPRLLLAVPTSTEVNDTLIEMVPHINFRRIGGRRYLLLPAFLVHDIPSTALSTWNPDGLGELIVGTTKGKLSKLFVGADDEGVPIEAYWQSSWMAVQAEEPKERLRRLNIELSGDASVDVFVDFGETVRFSQTFPTEAETIDIYWEGGKWEGGSWGEPGAYRFVRVRPDTRGRFHSVRFKSLPGGKPFSITAAELAIRGGKEH